MSGVCGSKRPPTSSTAGEDRSDVSGSDGRWRQMRVFWVAAVALLFGLIGVAVLVDNGNIAVPDDGVYAAQAKLRSMGHWSMVRPAATVDIDGTHSGIGPDLVMGDHQVPYPRHPLFTTILIPFFRLGGIGGMVILSVIGVWLASVTAGLLARRIDPSLGIPALMLAGLGSPLLFDSLLISAHGPATGMFGVTALGVTYAITEHRWRPVIYLLPAAALVVALRSEGVIAVTTLAAVTLFMSFRPHGRPRVDHHAAIVSVSLGLTAAAAYVVDALWTRSVTSLVGIAPSSIVREVIARRDPLSAAWASLFRPWIGDGQLAQPAIVLAVVALIVAAVAIRFAPNRWLLPVVLTCTSAVCLIYQLVVGPVMITGLVPAFSLMVPGLILLRWSDFRCQMVVRHLAVATVSVAAITATTYEVGGAVEWGGRFHHLMIPLLVPVVVVGLRHGFRSLPPTPARVASSAAIAAVMALSILAVQQHRLVREVTRATTSATRSATRTAAGSGHDQKPLVVMGLLQADGSSRMFWDPFEPFDVLRSTSPADLFSLISTAEASGSGEVTVITDIPSVAFDALSRKPLQRIGWAVRQEHPIDNTPFWIVEIGPQTSPSG